MSSVSVNPPKTPVTEGTNGVAAATLPNVCKMPGPPAPFVPTPLPNIGKSGTSPKNYSKSVTIEGKKVAIRGATFGSMGDVASKGTGGGLVSSNVEGPTSFVGPGSMNVKFEGKNVQLLGDPMLNNCGPRGSPANAATMMGVIQTNGYVTAVPGEDECPLSFCKKKHEPMEETEQTRKDASDLSLKLEAALRIKKKKMTTMLGVVHCKCGQKYADHSGATRSEFCDVLLDLGWHGPKEPRGATDSINKVHESMLNRFKDSPEATKKATGIWIEAQVAASDSDLQRNLPDQARTTSTAYPPGVCAAPKAIVLAWDAKAFPGSLSEQWFNTLNNETGSPIEFFLEKTGMVENRRFKPGEAVPPCKACVLILPLLLCPGNKEDNCQHTKG